ncbi:MAG TPA: HDOD domain-containing protein [Gallionellaceae bacterium]|nr:HDOD domain-containing protein [Gallionellaceae bacterium]
MPAKMIGRFEIVRELGRGAQGVVYLARDPQLERQVAIKTLRRGNAQQTSKLLHEARIASKLQHTHIIPLYDAGEQDGTPYLVYAYIEGETLAQALKRSGAMQTANAARIAASVLDALACAHGQGVMHLDIKPANVMVAANGQAMVMDFGIARIISQQPDDSGEITGTPQYMAPESISESGPQFSSDQFSVGMMLYEMVTGTPVVEGDNIYQILHRNANEQAEAPSSRNAQVDEKLEGIILKAIAKTPGERFPDAMAMRQALLQYLDANEGAEAGAGSDKHSTLEFLLRRMRSKSDFPALSGIITEINKIVASESESASKLAQTILQDFALTNKLLKIVNTVSYGQFGGNINTISKAVVILGFETVRNIAMSLILLEFMQNKAQAQDMKDEVIASFFAGIIAARLAPGTRVGEAEESLICAMFHNLGRMLAKFYFFEESQEINRLMQDQRLDEDRAAIRVLGLTFNDLGVGVAKSWNFPARLLAGMQKLPADKIRKPGTETEQLCVTVNMANELCMISAVTDPRDKEAALSKLSERYAGAANVSASIFSKTLEHGLNEFGKRAVVLGINTKQSPMLKRVRQWSGHAEPLPKAEAAAAADGMNGITTLDTAAAAGAPQAGETLKPEDSEGMLSAGIQDVTNTLVGDFQLNDVLRMVLETIYRSLGFRHALIMIRDNKQNQMSARFGFGEQVSALIPRFHFSLAFEPDVFHLAAEKGLDIVIEDVRAENIASKIPQWFHATVNSQCFLLLPLAVNKKTIGLIYADMQQANSLKLTQQQLILLKTLRNQAILAIKQKTM